MKEIVLTQGKVALVDDEDYEYLNQFKWCAHLSKKTGLWYAERGVRIIKGKQFTLGMHRVIMGIMDKTDIDHKDRNGLNNQKINLRICSRTLNEGNSILRKDSTTGIKGVHYHKGHKKYTARIQFKRKRIALGDFKTKQEAAIAYNEAAIKYFGEFARINSK